MALSLYLNSLILILVTSNASSTFLLVSGFSIPNALSTKITIITNIADLMSFIISPPFFKLCLLFP